MKTLETRIVSWIESKINPPQPKQLPKDNFVTDYLVMRLAKCIKCREIARQEQIRRMKEGIPYNPEKIKQAEYLINQITNRLNSRPYTTIYHMN